MSPEFLKPPMTGDIAATLHQYQLLQVAGRGGMGDVWKAWDTALERWVAIKFLRGASDTDAARFLREARLAARLRHPNIAVVHEVGEAPAGRADLPGRQFLVMDFVDGETLATARLDLSAALRLFAAVARAVDAAHRAGIIHRDLKPQNILLSREGWPFVTDFGLAKPMAPGGTLSATGAVVGTPAYMPPEQAQGRQAEIDERSDIYSLGATFYRVLTGGDPFEGATALDVLRQVTEAEPRAPRDRNPKLPVEVDTLLRKCLSKSRKDRYATAADLADDLERVLGGTRIRGRAPGPLRIALRRMRRSGVSLLLSGALVSIIAFGVWREFRLKPDRPPDPPPLPLLSLPHPGRQAQEAAVAAFLRTLSEGRISDLAVPDAAGLGEPIPSFVWIQRARPVLQGPASDRELVALLAAAVPMEDAFRALWPGAAQRLGSSIAGDVRAAADLAKAGRERLQHQVAAVMESWQGFIRGAPADFLLRHPEVEDLDRKLNQLAGGFPAPLPELGAIDLESCLKSADPEQELDRARRALVTLEARTGIDLESRQKLETMIAIASSYRLLLKGATEAEVVRDLAGTGGKLRKLGSAADPGDVSPRVRRILSDLLRQ